MTKPSLVKIIYKAIEIGDWIYFKKSPIPKAKVIRKINQFKQIELEYKGILYKIFLNENWTNILKVTREKYDGTIIEIDFKLKK